MNAFNSLSPFFIFLDVVFFGDTSITVTLGATAATKDQYADGYIYTNDNTTTSDRGEGQIYRIASNPAADGSATLAVTLAANDPRKAKK